MNTEQAGGGQGPAAAGDSRPLRIFLCYRREDSGGWAGRLHDRLSSRFGSEHVFFDIDRREPGRDFREKINEAVSACDVLVAMVGKEWLTVKDARGRRKIDRENDPVRVELEAALKRGVAVIPALVVGAEMPSAEELPETLASFPFLEFAPLRDLSFHADVSELIEWLERLEQEAAEKKRREEAARLEREAKQQEQAARKRLEREDAEREARERAERERAEQEERERAERERAEPARPQGRLAKSIDPDAPRRRFGSRRLVAAVSLVGAVAAAGVTVFVIGGSGDGSSRPPLPRNLARTHDSQALYSAVIPKGWVMGNVRFNPIEQFSDGIGVHIHRIGESLSPANKYEFPFVYLGASPKTIERLKIKGPTFAEALPALRRLLGGLDWSADGCKFAGTTNYAGSRPRFRGLMTEWKDCNDSPAAVREIAAVSANNELFFYASIFGPDPRFIDFETDIVRSLVINVRSDSRVTP